MKHIFNYCVYRIAKVYKRMHMSDYIGQGYYLMFFAFTFYALALTECVLSLFDRKINVTVIVLFGIPTIIEVLFFNSLFPNHEKIFKEYDTKYQHEKCGWLKSILVFMFVIMSLVCFMLALARYER